MRYIGNSPGLTQVPSPYDRHEMTSPTTNVNPEEYPTSWVNTLTGERFVCIDNTVDANVWVGNLGTTI